MHYLNSIRLSPVCMLNDTIIYVECSYFIVTGRHISVVTDRRSLIRSIFM